jgi:cobalt-zinc-cadmium efflux system outer membrane protein
LSHLKFQEARLAADAADGDIRSAQAGLAQALGLPFDQVLALPLGFDRLSGDKLPSMPDAGLQQAALQNRLDLQGGLARYAAAEAALREEIAKQYPDLDFSPGLLWDQGDWVKSLGAMILLPILNRNEGPIAEAEAKRKLEAARFKSLEADVFAQLTESRVRFDAAVTRWQTAKSLIATQTDRLASIKKSIKHGELDRLSLVESEIELLAAKRSELDARIAAHRAWSALEDAVQKPLDQSAPPPDGTDAAPAAAGAGSPP